MKRLPRFEQYIGVIRSALLLQRLAAQAPGTATDVLLSAGV